MIKFYWYPKCSTCRDAKKILEAKKLEFESIDIVATPPAKEVLQAAVKSGQYTLKQLFNTSGEVYRELNLKEKMDKIPDSDLYQLLNKNGKLIKRPFLTDGKTFIVGFDRLKYQKLA